MIHNGKFHEKILRPTLPLDLEPSCDLEKYSTILVDLTRTVFLFFSNNFFGISQSNAFLAKIFPEIYGLCCGHYLIILLK